MSQADIFYQAMLARDYRFDGKFFVGVKTTGVYCRPVCPAKPKRENVEFFSSALAAEKAGYRACLRCRPESAPFSPAWWGRSAVVQRALKLVVADEFFELNEDQFAERVGMTARHLRRLFIQEIGQSAKQISDSHRLNFCKKLVVETALPMTVVAETSGFRSLRRFNDAFKKRFSRSPSDFRKDRPSSTIDHGIELRLSYRPPYDWENLLRFVESHHIPGVEAVDQNRFSRIFKIGEEVGWLEIEPAVNALTLRMKIAHPKVLFSVVHRVRRMFDLDSDPLLVANRFSDCPIFRGLSQKFPGLRLPRGWDAFETAVATILGQLVSVERARNLVGQLVEHYGEPIDHPQSGQRMRIFPLAKTLAGSELSELKTTRARKETIREFSRRVLNRQILLSDAQDPARFRESLLAVKGIGPWSAEYISIRAIGDTDAFPKTDLVLRRVLECYPRIDLESVKPWRSYAALYLWKEFAKTFSAKNEGKVKK